MKYIISLFAIVIFFVACQTKEVVIYKEIEKKEELITPPMDDIIILVDNNISKEIVQEKINDINATIALVYSSKNIGKYSIKVSNIASIYASSNENMSLKFVDINDESNVSISESFDKLKENNITKALFYITEKNINNLYEYKNINDFDLYLPLIKKDSNNSFNNIVYGSIDYKKQLSTIKKTASSHLIEIYDNTSRSKKLHNIMDDSNVTSYILSGKYPNYKRFLHEHKLIADSSLILNISVVKSSILLSQISAIDDLNVTEILTTQNNYTPILFALTQNKDIENLIIASSISTTNDKIESMSKLLGEDILYDWVNYSTILGLEYLKYKNNNLFDNINIINNEVKYPVNLLKANNNSFKPYINEVNATIEYENLN